MENTKKEALTLVGITVRTTNQNQKAMKDIPELWKQFMEEKIGDKVPNKVDNTMYALYTDYEGDHMQPYTMLLGYQVENLDNVDEALTVKMVPEANYAKFTAKGDLTKEAVYDAWVNIWNTDLNRAYTHDLEIYGEKAVNPTDGEAEILIAIA
ncbi:GyrI-like domain-containing protein [Spongiimicrobium salis]|uniref:GyrI-like domain-containing protein n=1 Tax=Spongiimicrobium salis TaxID=1667022 RepID=UPI00374D301D